MSKSIQELEEEYELWQAELDSMEGHEDEYPEQYENVRAAADRPPDTTEITGASA